MDKEYLDNLVDKPIICTACSSKDYKVEYVPVFRFFKIQCTRCSNTWYIWD